VCPAQADAVLEKAKRLRVPVHPSMYEMLLPLLRDAPAAPWGAKLAQYELEARVLLSLISVSSCL
jgi:hypothetical protein